MVNEVLRKKMDPVLVRQVLVGFSRTQKVMELENKLKELKSRRIYDTDEARAIQNEIWGMYPECIVSLKKYSTPLPEQESYQSRTKRLSDCFSTPYKSVQGG